MASGSIHRCDLNLIMVVTVTVLRTCAPCPSVCDCQRYSTQKGIDCDGKDLDTVPAGIPTDTRFLRLEHNRLTRLPADVFSGLSLLIQLTLYNNQIADIEDSAFRDLVRLRKLHLESNNISLLTNHSFEGVPNLEELILRNNRLSSLPSGVFSQVPSLVELDLAHNGIRDFPTDISQDLRNVRMLDLSSNPAGLISTAIFEHMVSLQHLKLSSLIGISEIGLSGLAFDGLGNLATLNLDGNHLNKVPTAVRSLSNLTSLDIHSNAIETLNADDFYHPSLLEFLNLNDNQLTEIPTTALAQLPHLTTVFLDGNPISVISARAFWHNPRLSILSLADTNLTTIDANAFTGLNQLGTLYLQGNNLTTIVNGAMNSVNPNVYLLLTGNPLRCDCNLREFAAWLKSNHTGTLNGGSSLKCATPDRLRSSPLDDLNPNQFACEPRTTFPTTKVISVFMGKEVLLPCEIEADPVVDIFWITSSHATVHPDQLQPPFALADNGSLFVSTVNLIHEGLYTCVVSNDAGEVRNSVKLRVLRLPDLGSEQTPTIELGTHTPTDSSDRSNTSAAIIVGVVFFVAVVVGVIIYRKRRRKADTEDWELSTRTFDSEDEFNEPDYQNGGSLPSGKAPEPPQRPGAGSLTGSAGAAYVNESLSESLSLDVSYETRITPNEEAQWPLYEEIEDSRDDENNSETSLKPPGNTDVDQQGHQQEELGASVKQQCSGLNAVADVQQQQPNDGPAANVQQQHPDGGPAANVQQQHADGGPAANVQQQHPNCGPAANVQQQHAEGGPTANVQQQHPDGWPAANVQQQHPDGGPAANVQQQHLDGGPAANVQQHSDGGPAANVQQQHPDGWPAANVQQQHPDGWPAANVQHQHPDGWPAANVQQQHSDGGPAANVQQHSDGGPAANVQQQHPDRSPAAKLQQQHPDGWQAANVQQHPDGGPMNDYGFVENMKPSRDKRVRNKKS